NAQFKHKSEEVTYSIVDNSPKDAGNFNVYIAPVYAELYKPNSDVNLGFGAGFHYRLPSDLATIEMHYQNAYLDRLDEDPNASTLSGKPVNGTRTTMSLGGTV